MKHALRLCVGIGLSVSAASGLLAQTPPPNAGPPKVLQIFREEVKPGKAPAHQKWEMGWPKAFAKANWPTNYLTTVSVTGPSEAWFMTGYDSFAAWGKDIEGLDKNTAFKTEYDRLTQGDGEFLSGSRSIVGALREDLSTSVPVVLPTMRYFRVITFRVRLGHDSDFADAAKMIRAGYEKANVQLAWATYQIVSGMATPTFMVFLPMKSLDEIDTGLMNSKKLADAQGEENQKKMAKMAADGYLSVETNIYSFDPKMSYPAKDFAAADPEFWNPKPASPAKKPAAKPAQ
ncbi:MAG: hypothetical protein M3167_17280 [Acidobacteriota bacterium]|nr:hypothetical protein [Acidobacteriota bacterium]